ncbi:hypothetical protein BC936DRAFT_142712 [Jimgerdemannia flammicorona]|uniref:Uncharacterized protein n=1 Tax=Jimgerdemannia flammicorona TaxID=994334 RepID=A0A432ZZX7_9FUNG|nr:hypothetical protein BC936DRAFT_142712 [Jimgerdemannia flammicorona]
MNTTTVIPRQNLPVAAPSRSTHHQQQPKVLKPIKMDVQANVPSSANKAARVKTGTKGKRSSTKHKGHSSDNDIFTATPVTAPKITILKRGTDIVDVPAANIHASSSSDDTDAVSKTTSGTKKRNRPSKKQPSSDEATTVATPSNDGLEQGSETILNRSTSVHFSRDVANIDSESSHQDDTQHDSSSSDHTPSDSNRRERPISYSPTPKDNQRRNVMPPSKSRRAQRRKDIEAMTDALQNVDVDLLSVTPPSPSLVANLSSNESDDSGDGSAANTTTPAKKVPVSKKRSSPRKDDKKSASVSPPKLSAFPPLPSKPISTPEDSKSRLYLTVDSQRPIRPRRRSGSILELRNNNLLPSTPLSEVPEPTLSRTPSTPFLFEKVNTSSPLYAGPTFHNSPAPSALPLPSFYGRSLGDTAQLHSIMSSQFQPGDDLGVRPAASPATRSRTISLNSTIPHPYPKGMTIPFKKSLDDDLFQMDDLEDVSSIATDALRQKSRELLGFLAARHQEPVSTSYQQQLKSTLGRALTSPAVVHPQHRVIVPTPMGFTTSSPLRSDPTSYGLPLRMATGDLQYRNPLSLSEIQHNLRSMLKIEGRS